MKKSIFFLLLLFLSALCISPNIFAEETISFVSYYPSPFGAYDRVLLQPREPLPDPCQLGMIYFDQASSRLRICQRRGTYNTWTDMDVWAQNGNLIFTVAQDSDTFVGVGTTTPTEKFHVVGNTKLQGNLSVGDNLIVGASNSDCPSCATQVNGDAKVDKLFLKSNGTNVGELSVIYSGGQYHCTPYYLP